MRLDEILPRLDLIEILSGADRARRVSNVTRPDVPELPDLLYRGHEAFLPRATYLTLSPKRDGSSILQQSMIVVGLWTMSSALISRKLSAIVVMTQSEDWLKHSLTDEEYRMLSPKRPRALSSAI